MSKRLKNNTEAVFKQYSFYTLRVIKSHRIRPVCLFPIQSRWEGACECFPRYRVYRLPSVKCSRRRPLQIGTVFPPLRLKMGQTYPTDSHGGQTKALWQCPSDNQARQRHALWQGPEVCHARQRYDLQRSPTDGHGRQRHELQNDLVCRRVDNQHGRLEQGPTDGQENNDIFSGSARRMITAKKGMPSDRYRRTITADKNRLFL